MSRLRPTRISDLKITVTIPVGPEPQHRQWLDDCLGSIGAQTRLPDEVLLIDDMAGLPAELGHTYPFPVRIWRSPWLLGTTSAFNFGVALAEYDLVLMLGSDDLLAPACVESCLAQYNASGQQDAYYYLPFMYGFRGVEGYKDADKPSTEITNNAMVTKGLWKKTGGFPLVAAMGPCDYIMGAVLKKSGFPYILVASIPTRRETLYWFRIHDKSQTRKRLDECPGWPPDLVRDLVEASWRTPQWGRFK